MLYKADHLPLSGVKLNSVFELYLLGSVHFRDTSVDVITNVLHDFIAFIHIITALESHLMDGVEIGVYFLLVCV